jgi:hypothetical protein
MMRSILLFSFLCLATNIIAQSDSSNINPPVIGKDTALISSTRMSDSVNRIIHNADTAGIRQQMQLNTDYLVRLQQEHNSKQKRGAIIRIAFGLAMLVVLIIGLRRKRKK